MPVLRLLSCVRSAAILCFLACLHPQARADISGFGNGTGFSLNSGVTVNSGTAKLTDGGTNEARSIFFATPQSIVAFDVSFVYQESATVIATGGGFAFVIQKDPRAATAVGQNGTMLGYGGTSAISPSASVQVNLVSIAGLATVSNTGYATNGTIATTGLNSLSASTNLGGGDSIRVALHYNGSTLTETLTDLGTGATSPTYSYNAGNLSTLLGGSTAYIGFTGGTGTLAATQTISDFGFVAVPEFPGWGVLCGGGFLLFGSHRLYQRLRVT